MAKNIGFVVLSTQRSGTTYLSQLLDSHPEISMSSELFKTLGENCLNVDRDNYRYHMGDIYEYLDQFFEQKFRSTRAGGFTLMLRQLERYPEVKHYLKEKQIKCLFLERKNHLKIAVSRLKARYTGVYHTVDIEGDPASIEISIEDLVAELESIDRAINILTGISVELSAQHVLYEDLISARNKTLNNIQGYLTVNCREGLYSNLKKTNPEDLSLTVNNYAQVSAALEGTRYARYLDRSN